MALSSGTWIGLYEVLTPLGAGGMGDVYRAVDARLGRQVAIGFADSHWVIIRHSGAS